MQKVIVAGGAGFIGSYICRQLLEKGYLVVCIDNFITGDKKNIEDLDKNNNFHLLDHDLATEIPPSDLLNNISYIFHLASPASPNKKSKRSYINFPIETLLVNSVGSYNLLMLAKSQNARFLFASSSEIYGDPEVSPQTEDYFGNVNSRGIRSVYDEGKRFGEAITTAFLGSIIWILVSFVYLILMVHECRLMMVALFQILLIRHCEMSQLLCMELECKQEAFAILLI